MSIKNQCDDFPSDPESDYLKFAFDFLQICTLPVLEYDLVSNSKWENVEVIQILNPDQSFSNSHEYFTHFLFPLKKLFAKYFNIFHKPLIRNTAEDKYLLDDNIYNHIIAPDGFLNNYLNILTTYDLKIHYHLLLYLIANVVDFLKLFSTENKADKTFGGLCSDNVINQKQLVKEWFDLNQIRIQFRSELNSDHCTNPINKISFRFSDGSIVNFQHPIVIRDILKVISSTNPSIHKSLIDAYKSNNLPLRNNLYIPFGQKLSKALHSFLSNETSLKPKPPNITSDEQLYFIADLLHLCGYNFIDSYEGNIQNDISRRISVIRTWLLRNP